MPDASVFRFEDAPRDLSFRPADPAAATTLSADQVATFNERGYLAPLGVLGPAEADDLRHYVDWLVEQVVTADDRRNSYSINMYHRVCRRLYDLIHHPVIVGYARDILGPELVCWSTHMFCKLAGDGMDIPLHQDANYWPFTPTRSVSVWLAIDDVDEANSAMTFVPRSHLGGALEHVEVELDGTVVLNRRVSHHESYRDRVPNELSAGQASLHTDLLLHGSGPNTSDRRRCGIAIRYVGADVRAVAGGEGWISGAVHVDKGDPSGYWPDVPAPDGEAPELMRRFVGGFDGNS